MALVNSKKENLRVQYRLMVGIFDYHVLNVKSLHELKTYNRLAQKEYTIHKNRRYYFYCDSHLYGFYELKYIRDHYYYFKHNRYKPIYYYLPRSDDNAAQERLSDVKKILRLFKFHNTPKKTAYMQIHYEGSKVVLMWSSPYMADLFGRIEIPQSKEMEAACLQVSRPLMTKNHEVTSLSGFERPCRWLYEAIMTHEFLELLQHVSDIHLDNRTSIPLPALYDGKRYLLEQTRFTHHNVFMSVPPRSPSRKYRHGFCLMMSEYSDDMMDQEFEALLKLFKFQYKVALTCQRSLGNVLDLEDAMKTSQCVHFIGHGKILQNTFHFQVKKDTFLSVDTLIKKGVSAPKRLILSACYSLDRSLRKWFFTHGGQVLVGALGEVISSDLVELYRSFYWVLSVLSF